MLSRLGFIGSILSPEPDQLLTIENIIYTFVKGKLNISQARITVPVTKGGIGMICIKDYLSALKCAWVRRANKSQHGLWSRLIYDTGNANPDNFTAPPLCKHRFPVLYELTLALKKFSPSALSINNNILESVVLHNPLIDNKYKGSLYMNYIFENCGLPMDTFEEIKVKDLMYRCEVKGKRELEIALNIRLDYRSYDNVFRIVRDFLKDGLLSSQADLPIRPSKVFDILMKPKKGSKTYRKCISMANMPKKEPNANIFKKFLELSRIDLLSIPVPVPVPTWIKTHYNCSWYQYGASNKLSEFLFKFGNNLLGLNSRVHHFNRLVNEACTFCTLNKLAPAPRETFSHIFLTAKNRTAPCKVLSKNTYWH
jgi:hypothetical protein